MVADVASVGNASDTLVPAENGRITGRELHETAKAVLNDGDYEQALSMFEAILQAQMDRFGEEHSSVGAALHNVGVVRLRMGEHLIAEEVLVRALAIRRAVLGPEDLDLSVSMVASSSKCTRARSGFVLESTLVTQTRISCFGTLPLSSGYPG
jgi:Tetratricopeptide repeat